MSSTGIISQNDMMVNASIDLPRYVSITNIHDACREGNTQILTLHRDIQHTLTVQHCNLAPTQRNINRLNKQAQSHLNEINANLQLINTAIHKCVRLNIQGHMLSMIVNKLKEGMAHNKNALDEHRMNRLTKLAQRRAEDEEMRTAHRRNRCSSFLSEEEIRVISSRSSSARSSMSGESDEGSDDGNSSRSFIDDEAMEDNTDD